VFGWLDPFKGNGYQFRSGIGSGSPISPLESFGGATTTATSTAAGLSWHPHPDHGHPVCRRHHPDGKGL
jgi:hypothetical protein